MSTFKNLVYTILFVPMIIGLWSNCTKTPNVKLEDTKETPVESIVEDLLTQKVNTFFLVRHAEKALTGDNPSLTKEGQERAEELARLLEEVPIDAVYSTDYNRTMETATPTAIAKNIPIEKYDPSDLAAFVASFQRPSSNKKILIVGHSNTTPALINTFTNSNQYSSLSEKQYDNMYILSSVNGKVVDVLTIKYGEKSD